MKLSKQKFLTPDLTAHYQKQKNPKQKLLTKPNISCGIFQDCLDLKPTDYKNKTSITK